MNTITGTTGLTALLGSPVSHSISPLMHNTSFDLLGLDYVYLCFDVKEDALEDVVKGLTRCHIRGFNLTMPLKNRIVPLLDSLATEAQLIGAVNTVVVDENGRMTGHNTDGIGFVRSALDAFISEKVSALEAQDQIRFLAVWPAVSDGVEDLLSSDELEGLFAEWNIDMASVSAADAGKRWEILRSEIYDAIRKVGFSTVKAEQ